MSDGGTHRCRACATEVPSGALRCPSCNAAQGELAPCPHCRAKAGASPHAELRYVCDVCGGPRVPKVDASLRYSGREAASLRKANAARRARAAWRAAAVVAGITLPAALLFFGALMLIFGLGIKLALAAAVVLGPIGGALAMAIGRARGHGAEIPPAIDAAWVSVAADIAQQTRGGATAQLLAQKLGIDEAQADELVALLDVNEAVGGRMRFADAPLPPVPPGLTEIAPAGHTEIAAAEDEAAMAEQSSAAPTLARSLGDPSKP